MTRRHLNIGLALVLLIAGCNRSAPQPYIVLATTTSVGNSGLLDALLPDWKRQTGVEVRVALAGSGRALRMMEDGQAEVVISHAPHAEANVLARNHT